MARTSVQRVMKPRMNFVPLEYATEAKGHVMNYRPYQSTRAALGRAYLQQDADALPLIAYCRALVGVGADVKDLACAVEVYRCLHAVRMTPVRCRMLAAWFIARGMQQVGLVKTFPNGTVFNCT